MSSFYLLRFISNCNLTFICFSFIFASFFTYSLLFTSLLFCSQVSQYAYELMIHFLFSFTFLNLFFPLVFLFSLLQFALTSVNMLSWAIPLRNKNLTENSKLLGLANSFAGGIFLMLAFGHMLPHSVGVLESIGADRNIAFKFTLVGYLLVFFIEKIAFNSHALLHDAMDNGSDTAHTHTHNTHNTVKEVTNIMSENVQYGQSVLTASLDTATVSLGQGPGPSFQNMNQNFNIFIYLFIYFSILFNYLFIHFY